jgi:carboxyl-terminal processing protease
MNMNKAFYPLLISIILAGGIFIGYKIQDRNAAKSGMYSSSDGNSKLENILQLIEARYVDTVNTEKIIR